MRIKENFCEIKAGLLLKSIRGYLKKGKIVRVSRKKSFKYNQIEHNEIEPVGPTINAWWRLIGAKRKISGKRPKGKSLD